MGVTEPGAAWRLQGGKASVYARPAHCGHSPMIRALGRFLAVLALAGCATPPAKPPPADRAPAAVGAATDVRPVWPGDVMPAPPGGLNPDVTQATIGQTICAPGWTATVRPSSTYTNGVKAKLLREHGLQPTDADRFELDHLVPLALGGHPRRIENLWLQPWVGEWSARRKDQLEVRLKTLVCSGAMPLAEARRLIAADWRAAWVTLVGGDARPAGWQASD